MPPSESITPPPPPSNQNTNSFLVFFNGLLLLNPLAAPTIVFHGAGDPDIDGLLPASKKSIEDMPSIKITETTLESEEEACAICLGEYEIGGEAKEMPCKHRYHAGCIERWLGVHGSCPVCRYEMPVEEGSDGGEKGYDGGRRENEEIRISIFFGRSSEGDGATDGGSLSSTHEDMEGID